MSTRTRVVYRRIRPSIRLNEICREDPGMKAIVNSHAATAGGIRQDVVERVRRELAEGTYTEADKLNGAVNRLLDELQLSY